MKMELISRLFKEFDKDKKVIEKNILQVMDIITLQAKDEYGSLTMTIKYERNDENEFIKQTK